MHQEANFEHGSHQQDQGGAGTLTRCKHASTSTSTDMTFATFVPDMHHPGEFTGLYGPRPNYETDVPVSRLRRSDGEHALRLVAPWLGMNLHGFKDG